MSPGFRILPTAVVAFLTQLISGLFDLLTGVGTAMMYTLQPFKSLMSHVSFSPLSRAFDSILSSAPCFLANLATLAALMS